MESNIRFYEHALSQSECDELIRFLYKDTFNSVSLDYNSLKRTKAIDHDIVKKLSVKCGINFDRAFIMKYNASIGSPMHTDNYSIENNEEVFNSWKYSGVVFLNQEFDGGELVYPNQGIFIKPITGNMVIAPADESAPHFVNPPSSDRYVLVLRII